MYYLAQCVHDISISHGLIISMFLAGLFGGSTHCVIMCSPFVLAQIGDDVSIKKTSSYLLLPYHMGRLTTYVALAILLSSVVNLAFLYSNLRGLIAAPMLILAGIIFVVSAFPKLSIIFPWAVNIRISAPYKLISKLSNKLIGNNSILGRYFLGVLLGFMPCGLVVSALLASSSAPDILQSALAMAAFSVGTMPALFFVAFAGHVIKKEYSAAIINISRFSMVISSIWLFVLAANMMYKTVL